MCVCLSEADTLCTCTGKGKANNSDGKKKEGEGKTKEVEGQKKESEQEDFEQKEFYIMKHYDSVKDSVKLFADDDLVRKPGTVSCVGN